jgi:hypothetical protein
MGCGSVDSTKRQTLTEAVLLLEFGVIVLLVWAVSLEYRANQYMQIWADQNAPLLGYLLNGYLAAIMAGVLLGSIALYVQYRPGRGERRSSSNP